MGLNLVFWFLQSSKNNEIKFDPRLPRVRYARYRDAIDLAGQNIIALSGATRDDARRLIPFLVAPDQMQQRVVPVAEATATMIPEVADEIHEFTRATQGGIKIRRLLLKDGIVTELMLS